MANEPKTRDQLKLHFVKNAMPTEGHFAELIDSQLNQRDDGLFKEADQPLALVAAPGDQQRLLRLYAAYPAPNPDWLIALNPKDPKDPSKTVAGLGIADSGGGTKLLLDANGNLSVTGSVSADTVTANDHISTKGLDLVAVGLDRHRPQFESRCSIGFMPDGQVSFNTPGVLRIEGGGALVLTSIDIKVIGPLTSHGTLTCEGEFMCCKHPNNEHEGTLKIGDWMLQATATDLHISCGSQEVARFSITEDRFKVFQRLDNRESYFFFDDQGKFGLKSPPSPPPPIPTPSPPDVTVIADDCCHTKY